MKEVLSAESSKDTHLLDHSLAKSNIRKSLIKAQFSPSNFNQYLLYILNRPLI